MPLTLKELADMNKNAPGLDGSTHLIPYGIPDSYNFKDAGAHYYTDVLVPPNYAAGTGYIHNAPRADKPNPPAKSMESKDGLLWYRNASTKQWAKVQPEGAHVDGFFEKTDFRGNTGHPFPITQGNPATLQTPVYDEIGHWWPTARGAFSQPIDAVFSVYSLRVKDASMSGLIIAQCGVDWWTNANSGTNTAAGLSDWRMITDQWLDFAFINYKGYTPEGVEAWLKANPIPYTYKDDSGGGGGEVDPPPTSGSGLEVTLDGKTYIATGSVTLKAK